MSDRQHASRRSHSLSEQRSSPLSAPPMTIIDSTVTTGPSSNHGTRSRSHSPRPTSTRTSSENDSTTTQYPHSSPSVSPGGPFIYGSSIAEGLSVPSGVNYYYSGQDEEQVVRLHHLSLSPEQTIFSSPPPPPPHTARGVPYYATDRLPISESLYLDEDVARAEPAAERYETAPEEYEKSHASESATPKPGKHQPRELEETAESHECVGVSAAAQDPRNPFVPYRPAMTNRRGSDDWGNDDGSATGTASSEVPAGLPGKESAFMPRLPDELATKLLTDIRAGNAQRSFHIPSVLLTEQCPYFNELVHPPRIAGSACTLCKDTAFPAGRLTGPFYFPDLDEQAFGLFLGWLIAGWAGWAGEQRKTSATTRAKQALDHADATVNVSTSLGTQHAQRPTSHPPPAVTAMDDEAFIASANKSLSGPRDFHSLQHYLCLYVLAARFEAESLKNRVIDLVRAYYRGQNMTAPAFRIEYVYSHVDGRQGIKLRKFLVGTAVYRAIVEAAGSAKTWTLNDPMRKVVAGGGDLAADFAEAAVKLAGGEEGPVDVRRFGEDDCTVWHEHERTRVCKKGPASEPWEA
ncbi:MAG: hypothetical protein M1831_005599 [Alyxoria varia]|nr:MAG: hypothetical protein M1831_005599 [Alyxoria varia]